jgi:hypothetical protein
LETEIFTGSISATSGHGQEWRLRNVPVLMPRAESTVWLWATSNEMIATIRPTSPGKARNPVPPPETSGATATPATPMRNTMVAIHPLRRHERR